MSVTSTRSPPANLTRSSTWTRGLTADRGAEEGKYPGWQLSGKLGRDEEILLGITSGLSQPAWEELDGGNVEAGTHPTFSKDNGMVLEIELEWVDENGQVLASRRLLTPFTVGTRYWVWNPKPIIAGIVVVGGLIFSWVWGPGLVRRWKARHQRSGAEDGSDLLPAAKVGSADHASMPGFFHWLGNWWGEAGQHSPVRLRRQPA